MKNPKSHRDTWTDYYSQKAKKDDYPARSVYKLKEIQEKYHIIKRDDRVLDLGCSPGSWLLYAADLTGNKGEVVGVDLNPVIIRLPSHVRTIVGDVITMSSELLAQIGKSYNVVISDMAPSTTGNSVVDTARSLYLCEAAFLIAQQILVPRGSFICKIFQGEDFKRFSDMVKMAFHTHKIFKPKSSRKASREIYIIGSGKK